MNSPEREEVESKLAGELGWKIEPAGSGKFWRRRHPPIYKAKTCRYATQEDIRLWDALISREMRVRELEGRMEWLLHTVERLMLGKPVRDLDEVISAARLALNSKGEKG